MPRAPKPLTETQLDELGDFLEVSDGHLVDVEMLDGFFAALVCSPEPVMPSEFLPMILGETQSLATHDDAKYIIDALMQHWNCVAHQLQETFEQIEAVYHPLLIERAEDASVSFTDTDETAPIKMGTMWAAGFMVGVSMQADAWETLFENEDIGGAVMIINMLASELSPDVSERQTRKMTPDERQVFFNDMFGGVPLIYKFFKLDQHLAGTGGEAIDNPPPSTSVRRTGPKVGRNDACPCGSGKTFKQCCGKGGSTLH